MPSGTDLDPYTELLGALRLDPWAGRAACIGRWDILEGSDVAAAKALCASCPVRGDCDAWVFSLPSRTDPDGVTAGYTRTERKEARRHRSIERNNAPRPVVRCSAPPTTKICTKCDEPKEVTEFYLDVRTTGGYSNICTDCKRAGNRAAAVRRRQKRASEARAADPNSPKQCEGCKKEKARATFGKAPRAHDGLAKKCRDCMWQVKERRRNDRKKVAA